MRIAQAHITKPGSLELSARPRDDQSKFPICALSPMCEIQPQVVKPIGHVGLILASVCERQMVWSSRRLIFEDISTRGNLA